MKLIKYNRKPKMYDRFKIAGFFSSKFFCYEVFAKQKKEKRFRYIPNYVCVRERERERESMTHEHRQVVRQVCSGRRIFEGCALHDGGCHGQ